MAIKPTKATIPTELIAAVKKFSGYPVRDFNASLISQPFGVNWVSFNGQPGYSSLGLLAHNGIDLKLDTGTELFSPLDGTAVFLGESPGGGKEINLATTGFTVKGYEQNVIRLRVIFLHLYAFLVPLGRELKGGVSLVAKSDNTGIYTTGPHLHWGLKIDKKTPEGWEVMDKDNGFGGCVDPELFFPDRSYEYLPVDVRYQLPYSAWAETYKKSVTPWLRWKLGRMPSERELNAFAYGRWAFEEVQNPAMYGVWSKMTKAEFRCPPFPRPLGI